MVMAMRKFDEQMIVDFIRFQSDYKSQKPPLSYQFKQEHFESDFTFLGITAVEDVLQWQAGETIERLRESGIKVWICTGDKQETTHSVARACGLTQATNPFELDGPNNSAEVHLTGISVYELTQTM